MHWEWKQLKVYNETARELMYLLPSDNNNMEDLTLFQQAINAKEAYRTTELVRDKREELNVIVDRTRVDNLIYAIYNIEQWNAEWFNYMQPIPNTSEIYDAIILLTTPIKSTWTEEFALYNDTKFIESFNDTIRNQYGDKVIEFDNAVENRDEIISTLLHLYKNKPLSVI